MLRVLLSHLRRCDYSRDFKKYCKGCRCCGIFQNVADVAVLLKCCKCCSVLKNCGKYCKDFQKKNVAGAAGLFECCRDVNKRCKCARFPKTLREFALLHLCVELIETISSLFAI